MRTALILLAGCSLLAAFTIYARLFAAQYPHAITWATVAFLVLWFVATGFNMWVGVSHAGYSVRDEASIMALLFGVPAILALVLPRVLR